MLTLRQGVRFTLTLWTLGCLTTMTSFSAQAANVSVTDTDGIPLENAVVEVYYQPAAPSDTQTKNIVQRNASFNPRVTTIPTGSYVAFPNEDTTRHHVLFFTCENLRARVVSQRNTAARSL